MTWTLRWKTDGRRWTRVHRQHKGSGATVCGRWPPDGARVEVGPRHARHECAECHRGRVMEVTQLQEFGSEVSS